MPGHTMITTNTGEAGHTTTAGRTVTRPGAVFTAVLLGLACWVGAIMANPAAAQGEERLAAARPEATEPFEPGVYAARREAFMAQLGDGLAIIQSAPDDDADPDTNFGYLTGLWEETGATLVLAPAETGGLRETLFLRERTPESEVWYGERLPLGAELYARVGVGLIMREDRMDSILAQLIRKHPTLHYLGPIVGPNEPVPATLELLHRMAERCPGAEIVVAPPLIDDMRVVKDEAEIEVMRAAIAATQEGLKAGMAAVRPGMRERELQSVIEHQFIVEGAQRTAFDSIVGSGPNATILHYNRSTRVMQEGELVLVDMGAEVGRYAADITRTFPVSGVFSDRQREIYDVVHEAHEAARARLRAGVTVAELTFAVQAVFAERGVAGHMPHGLSHFVGLYVHDVGDISAPLPAGAVITIEPGLYFPDEGLGVRLEDQYLVTDEGSVHLSDGLPRTSAEIEAFMAQGDD